MNVQQQRILRQYNSAAVRQCSSSVATVKQQCSCARVLQPCTRKLGSQVRTTVARRRSHSQHATHDKGQRPHTPATLSPTTHHTTSPQHTPHPLPSPPTTNLNTYHTQTTQTRFSYFPNYIAFWI